MPESVERKMWRDARRRAKRKGIPFSLEVDDIHIPKACPLLGLPLFKGEGRACDNSPTLDRIIPSLGYVSGNVMVVSSKANKIKSDASLEQISLLVSRLGRIYLDTLTQTTCDK